MNTQIILISLSLLIRLFAIGMADLIAEEAYYWNYANHLDFGYLDHPPMVAVLIKLSTLLFGVNEFGVRFMSVVCWGICAGFSYKLTERISSAKIGLRSIFLLSILPFFFLHSLIITPDLPLIAAWSACLYYLYLALVEEDKTAWLWVGLWLGLGMLSKYSIVLLGPASIIYIILTRKYKHLLSPYPYYAILIAAVMFSPVIYWNATHQWASFAFQSTRRFAALDQGSLLAFFGLLILFLTPIGVIGLVQLLLKPKNRFLSLPSVSTSASINQQQKRFIQCFTLTPLLFFAAFSLTHLIKFNWIGPSLLALIPWLALIETPRIQRAWSGMGICLLLGYVVLLFGIIFGQPKFLYQPLLSKYIDWNDFSRQVYQLAENAQQTWRQPITLLPIDRYNVASELTFYQNKAYQRHQINKIYPVAGIDLFGYESLMYHYWAKNNDIADHVLLLIAENPSFFERPTVKDKIVVLSPVQQFWTHNQGKHLQVNPYYYEFVRLK